MNSEAALPARFRLWVLGLFTGMVMANAVLFRSWWHLVFLVLGLALIGLGAFLMTRQKASSHE